MCFVDLVVRRAVGFTRSTIVRLPPRILLQTTYTTSSSGSHTATALHVECAERRTKCGIIFMHSLFYEYIDLEYVRVPVEYRVHQAEYKTPILVAAPQAYGNTYSTRRTIAPLTSPCRLARQCLDNTDGGFWLGAIGTVCFAPSADTTVP